jgi:hypothetical protein
MKSLVALASVLLAMSLAVGNASADDAVKWVEKLAGHFKLHLRYFDYDKNAYVEVELPNPLIPVPLPPDIQKILAASLKDSFDAEWNGTKDSDGKTRRDKACDQIKDQTAKSIKSAINQNTHDFRCNLQAAGELRAKIEGNNLLFSYLIRNNSVEFKVTTPCLVSLGPLGCSVTSLGADEDPKFTVSFDSDLVIDIVVPPDISVRTSDTSGKIVIKSAIVHAGNAKIDSGNFSGDILKGVNSLINTVGVPLGVSGYFAPAERRINNMAQDQTAAMVGKFAALSSGLDNAMKYGFTKLNARIDAPRGDVVFRLDALPQAPAIEDDTKHANGPALTFSDPRIALAPTQAHPGDQLTVTGQYFNRPTATELLIFIVGGIGAGTITHTEVEWGPQNAALRRDKVARKNFDPGALLPRRTWRPTSPIDFMPVTVSW